MLLLQEPLTTDLLSSHLIFSTIQITIKKASEQLASEQTAITNK